MISNCLRVSLIVVALLKRSSNEICRPLLLKVYFFVLNLARLLISLLLYFLQKKTLAINDDYLYNAPVQ